MNGNWGGMRASSEYGVPTAPYGLPGRTLYQAVGFGENRFNRCGLV